MENHQSHSQFEIFCLILELLVGIVTFIAILIELFTQKDMSHLFMPLLVLFYSLRAFNERETRRYAWDLFCAIGILVLMIFMFYVF